MHRQQRNFFGKTFVITGNVNHFANRNELKALIESMGGKVAGSITEVTHRILLIMIVHRSQLRTSCQAWCSSDYGGRIHQEKQGKDELFVEYIINSKFIILKCDLHTGIESKYAN